MHTTVHIPSFSIHALQVRVFVHNHTITNKLFSYHSHHYATKTVSFINHCHSARRPWTSKGPPTLGPYKNIPDIYLRRGRRKDETPTLRLVRRMSYAHRTLGRKNISGKLWYGPKAGRPLNVAFKCNVLFTTLAEWVTPLWARPLHFSHRFGCHTQVA